MSLFASGMYETRLLSARTNVPDTPTFSQTLIREDLPKWPFCNDRWWTSNRISARVGSTVGRPIEWSTLPPAPENKERDIFGRPLCHGLVCRPADERGSPQFLSYDCATRQTLCQITVVNPGKFSVDYLWQWRTPLGPALRLSGAKLVSPTSSMHEYDCTTRKGLCSIATVFFESTKSSWARPGEFVRK